MATKHQHHHHAAKAKMDKDNREKLKASDPNAAARERGPQDPHKAKRDREPEGDPNGPARERAPTQGAPYPETDGGLVGAADPDVEQDERDNINKNYRIPPVGHRDYVAGQPVDEEELAQTIEDDERRRAYGKQNAQPPTAPAERVGYPEHGYDHSDQQSTEGLDQRDDLHDPSPAKQPAGQGYDAETSQKEV